ncbi:hypothetical protein [Acidiluteibacter ferrifornacis]|uniref:Uncharacterized protein n=1 Tax=Acidiluteibacter ferrifornacis TaxID=2692424 RepID=A0A6N9NMP7_9FLAO|nr:hypothetical protein [Acidiluteibacter ferrifornacis]NBG66490.1 hypothetical protein [Acidiluteibacter ferrifornacis]
MQNTPLGNISFGALRTTFAAITFGLVISFASCAEGEKKVVTEEQQEKPKDKNENTMFEIEGKVFSIPSPIQTALLLKDAGTSFDGSILNPTANITKYTTSTKRAINLGIYGADLGYVTIFDQTQSSISYLAATKSLATDLGIANIFDQKILSRFEKNIGNRDSLLSLVSDAFKSTDQFLKKNQQEQLGVLILAGGWIETLHFATKISGSSGNQKVIDRIGEQKITLENLMKLLLTIEANDDVTQLLGSLQELRDIYNGVNYVYEYKEPITDVENKTTTITSVSKIEMSPEILKSISDKISSIRNNITL